MSTESLTEEQKSLSDELTHLQRMTIIGMVCGNKSQRQAYYDAGGKAKTGEAADVVVSRMLTDVKVKAFYDSLVESAATEAVMTREQALERLTLVANTKITDILDFKYVEVETVKDGEVEVEETTIWRMKESEEINKVAASAIKSVTMTKHGPKIEMYDAVDAIKTIAKMQGWEAAQKLDVKSTVVDDGTNEW